MKDFIKLNTLCYTEESAQLEELGINSEQSLEYKPYYVRKSAIISFGQTDTIGSYILISDGEKIQTLESPDDIIKLLQQPS